MKKLTVAILATAVMLSAVACGSKTTEPTKEETPATEAAVETEAVETEAVEAEVVETEAAAATGVYKVYNNTGMKVTDIYLYEAGSEDKGENYAGDGMRAGRSVELTYEGTESTVLVLEFTTEDGETQAFETLHIEEAPIALLSADAASGATPICFEVPQGTGTYTVYNTTGMNVTDLYLYPAGSEDKGENLAAEGLADADSVEISYSGDIDSVLVLEFKTEDGETQVFETLHIEEAPISLLSVDAASGATPISFTQPE